MRHTFYEMWRNGYHGYVNLGSFQSHIFHAYAHADQVNMRRLELAFPEFFVHKLYEAPVEIPAMLDD
jgi:hypothetical protein